MGRFIEVDYRKLEAAADNIERIMASHDRELNQTETYLLLLHQAWQGSDYDAFRFAFQGDDGVKKTGLEVSKGVKGYADFLRYCASQYKTAQIDAVNRADDI